MKTRLLFFLCSVMLSLFSFAATHQTHEAVLSQAAKTEFLDEEEDTDMGVYRIELMFSGNLSAYSPNLVVSGFVDTTACPKEMVCLAHSLAVIKHKNNLDEEVRSHLLIENEPSPHAFLQYEDAPELFSAPLVFTSLPISHGIDVRLLPKTREYGSIAESKIKVVMKGYFKDTLILTDTLETASIYATDAEIGNPDSYVFLFENLTQV